jgi:hypothetical protein
VHCKVYWIDLVELGISLIERFFSRKEGIPILFILFYDVSVFNVLFLLVILSALGVIEVLILTYLNSLS